jgi:hypothetical protein
LLWLRRKFSWPFSPALARIDLSSLIPFLVKKSNKCLELRRSFRSLVNKENLLTLDSATRRIRFIIRCRFRIDEFLITPRIVVFLEKFKTSSGKLKKKIN